ncbi:MAG: ABC transporter ATP-binding protein [Gammaproteobacteria bacterium]|jgi:putative ABC transport system ATP-binding protein
MQPHTVTRQYRQFEVQESNSPVVEAHGVEKRVPSPEGDLTILSAVDLAIFAGETVAVIGASGSGKSTLLGLLAGLDLPTSGIIRLDGHDLTAIDEDGRAALRGQLVGFVFQSFQLLPNLTAVENVMLPLELAGNAYPRRRAEDILERVGLQHRRQHYPRQLSGGEQQRVAIARAFATQPKVLFADEPTGNLDQKTGGGVADLLFELNREQRTTLVLVTHDPCLADPCNRVVRLDNGRLTP